MYSHKHQKSESRDLVSLPWVVKFFLNEENSRGSQRAKNAKNENFQGKKWLRKT